MKILITGSLGLVGSESVKYYLERGHIVIGVDNNMRGSFFGESGSVTNNLIKHNRYFHINKDIGLYTKDSLSFDYDVIIHAAAQPSHDFSAKEPVLDFYVNAANTVLLLERFRASCPDAVFVYLSTNKVYGDQPNYLPLFERETRWEIQKEHIGWNGVDEEMWVDQCTHSPFGVSKLAADLMVQEYGRYFGLKTGVFRLGCITGKQHKGVELHGFLSYMARCKKEGKVYKIYGYKGKQVRDNIHAFDLVCAIDHFINAPRMGEVYNMGGGRHSNTSVLEALNKFDIKDWEYYDTPRKGDHIWYISDVSKFQSHYPDWEYKYDMDKIFEELMQ